MNNKSLIAIVAVASIVGGLVGGFILNKVAPLVGGDFAGGVLPSQLFTASASGGVSSNGYVSPVGNLALLSNGAIGAGGVSANNAVSVIYTATAAYPSSLITLGPISATTSTAVTSVAFVSSGFSIGDVCNVGYNGASSTAVQGFGADGFVTAVSGNNVTATITFWNGATSTIPLNVTSSATGVSSTLKATCFHTGV